MEQLQSMLREYNLNHLEDLEYAPWSKQYTRQDFPIYWKIVFTILKDLDKNLNIIEVGCGLGDVTTIPCYLGFKNVKSYEKDREICNRGQRRIHDLFGMDYIIENKIFPNNIIHNSDILIVVNCAYADLANSKNEYLELMQTYFIKAGKPKYFLMEVIDSSYTIEDNEFPEHLRMSKEDVNDLFPLANIQFWQTYKYPINKKSKTLYLIKHK